MFKYNFLGGEKWKEVKMMFSPFLSKGNQTWNILWVTKFETFIWPLSKDVSPLNSKHQIHSKGHQAWNLPLAFKLNVFLCLPPFFIILKHKF
jgi:hypothetical protein